MSGSDNIDLEAEALRLIDLSSENDNQSSGDQIEGRTFEFSGVVGCEKEVKNTPGFHVDGQMPKLHESTDPEKTRRNGRCNLRKSLAWDSAFFNNAGVLDPEELSIMIKGAEKDKNNLLPGIEEELRRSIESISTLESDNFTMESLEDDLFVDIRASIQRSSKKAPSAINFIKKSASTEIDNQAISTLEKEDPASQNQPSEPALKNTSRQTINIPKCQPKKNVGMQGSGKAVKQDSRHSQVTQSVTKMDKSSSLCPIPPKAIKRATLTSVSAAKRDSMSSSRVKSETGSSKLSTVSVSGKGTQTSKVAVSSGARRVLPKPAPLSKSSSLGSSTTSKVSSTRSSTSSEGSDCVLPKTAANSSLMTARRSQLKSSTRSSSSGLIPETPSKAGVKDKSFPSTLTGYLKSTKISSSLSPASSISEWSSASSSSSSTVYQRSGNSRNSLDISSCQPGKDSNVPLGLRNRPTDRVADGHERKAAALPGNNSTKSSAQTGNLQGPAKPSGLRMPSRKIGFFDGVKPLARTPNGTPRSQSGLGNALTKCGTAVCSPKGGSNLKPKIQKLPTARGVSSLANVKPDSPKLSSPASFPEKSGAPTNDSHALADVKHSASLSLKVQENRSRENFLKSQKVQAKLSDGNKQDLDTGEDGLMNENFGGLFPEVDFKMHSNMLKGDIKIDLVEENIALGSKTTEQGVDKDVSDDANNQKCSHLIYKTSEGQVEELSGPKRDVNKNVYGQKDECLSETSSPTTSTTASREPFALKDSFCNSECPEFSKESALLLVEKLAVPLPTSEQKENS